MSYLRYVMTELISKEVLGDYQFNHKQLNQDEENTQELPVAQKNESKVQDNPGNTAGEGTAFVSTDNATGDRPNANDGPLLKADGTLAYDSSGNVQ